MSDWKDSLNDIPEPMRSDLIEEGEAFASDRADDYREADDAGKADMLAFHLPMSGVADEPTAGEHIRQRVRRDADGTPTATDLNEALKL